LLRQRAPFAALGTAYKTIIGEFPESFEIFVGIPDLLFGISALKTLIFTLSD